MERLTVSLVLYRPDAAQLKATLDSLVTASRAADVVPDLFLIDNGGSDAVLAGLQLPDDWQVHVFSGHGNVGFGCGHNLSLDGAGDVHLILNPDLELAPDALVEARAFFRAHPECGLIAPAVHAAEHFVLRVLQRHVEIGHDLAARAEAVDELRRDGVGIGIQHAKPAKGVDLFQAV